MPKVTVDGIAGRDRVAGGGVSGRSNILMAVGIVVAFVGLAYLFFPPVVDGKRDGMSQLIMPFWLLPSGIGIFLHKRAAYIYYCAGALLLLGFSVFGMTDLGISISEMLRPIAVEVIVLAAPALMAGLRFSRFEPLMKRGLIHA